MNKEEALKFLKNKNNIMLVGVIILGILFMTAFHSAPTEGKKEAKRDVQEEKLERILSDIDGAGKVKVMITYEDTGEKDIAYEKRQNDTSYDEKAVMSDGSPLVIRETGPAVRGVIVTADGADDVRVKKALTDAVSAALDVEPHKICIYKKTQ